MRAAFGLFLFSMERLDPCISPLGPVASETMLPPVSSFSHFKENRKIENREVQVFRTQCCHFYLASSPV